jgi:hypothetical protein
MSPSCENPVPFDALISYWLDANPTAGESGLEAHLFACAGCSQRLERLVRLGAGLRQALREGRVHAVLNPAFLRKLRRDGLRVREYRLQPGGNVACTVTPDDDLVVAYLQADLGDVRRLDLVYHDVGAGTHARLEDVAFDRESGGLVLTNNIPALRKLGSTTIRMQLLSVDATAQRELGSYTFNHSRFDTSAG